MRTFSLFAFWVLLLLGLPAEVTAQHVYYLTAQPGVRHVGDVDLNRGKITVKDAEGKHRWTMQEVDAIQFQNSRFKQVRNLRIASSAPFTALVEVLDSGQVALLKYKEAASAADPNNIFYFLQKGTDSPIYLDSPNFRYTLGRGIIDVLWPLVTNRPDLQEALTRGGVKDYNFFDFIHALNTGTPYVQLKLNGEKVKVKEKQ